MTYAGVQMFMDKLNQLINSNDIPSINYPEIMCEKPLFQLLYQELTSMIQTLFMSEHQDLQKLIDLKQRFIYAAEETEYNVDLFLSVVHTWNTFDDARRSFKSIEMKGTRKYGTDDDGVKTLVETLQQLINFFKNPSNIGERPQLQRLCDTLDTVTRNIYIFNDKDIDELIDLKDRITAAAVALTGVHLRNNNRSLSRDDDRRSVKSVLSSVHFRNTTEDFPTSGLFNRSLDLDDVRISLMFIKAEFKSMRIDGMKMDSSPRPQTTLNQSVAGQSSISRNSPGSKKLMDEIFVGIDQDHDLIRDKLVEDQRKLDVVSIVGMGGIGKTTLATKVFNDAYVKHHFYVRVWVTVSQTYDKKDLLIQILESISGQRDLKEANESQLRELVHKNLMGKRYLIVIDDIWDRDTWDKLKVFFPHDNNGSRILLTSRLTEVARHANSNGLIHHLGYLSKEKGWELLCHKVFQGNECPEWSIKLGMQISENCQGLPLAVVAIAGVLAKESGSEEFWVEVAKKTGSYVIGEQNGCMEILGLSYNHLPLRLRECFLYLGGFPEDYKIQVKRLIWLWVAEGFIEADENRRLEDIAEGYLMDLIDRNLVIVADRRKSNGDVKACKVHDLVRELCLKKAKEGQFLLKIKKLEWSSQLSKVKKSPYRPERMFIVDVFGFPLAQNCRSVFVFDYIMSFGDFIAKNFHSFVLLRVLNLERYDIDDFPKSMELLVHLRYLAIRMSYRKGFPSSICKLWNLQTLIFSNTRDCCIIDLPKNISDLVNLRHLVTYEHGFGLCSIEKPMKLQTISKVFFRKGVDHVQKYFPYIKELTCTTYSDEHIDFRPLTYLEKLKLTSNGLIRWTCITFPATLKTLKLARCWVMSIIHWLPNLEVLKLHRVDFEGRCWNTDGQEFPQLKFLRLKDLAIKQWEAYSRSFPCLRQLQIISCNSLKEIPLEIGDIPMLELIQTKFCRRSVAESVRRIEEEQHDLGNYDLKIDIQNEWGPE